MMANCTIGRNGKNGFLIVTIQTIANNIPMKEQGKPHRAPNAFGLLGTNQALLVYRDRWLYAFLLHST